MAPALLTQTQRPRILFLDAYDSFSNNIVALIEQNIEADVIKIFIDDQRFVKATDSNQANFLEYLRTFDAVVAGPGPGWAKCDKDVGLIKDLWNLQDEYLLPVLGICLGFQSLCLAFGADIERLEEPKHGIISSILHNSSSIFRDVGKLDATQYHSLHVKLDHSIQNERAVRYPSQLWEPTKTCPDLEPLAWDFDCNSNGAILMGIRHMSKPFCGVQFHPESICTNTEAARIVQNFWEDAQEWNRGRTYNNTAPIDQVFHGQIEDYDGMRKPVSSPRFDAAMRPEHVPLAPSELASLVAHGDGQQLPDLPPSTVHCVTVGSGRLTVADVCEALDMPRHEAIVLESGLQEDLIPMAVGTGRYSIVGVVIPGETLRLHYYAGSRKLQLRDGHDAVYTEWVVADPWPYIKEVMKTLQPSRPPQTKTWAPFWGGLMGYASYEAGLETINVSGHEEASYPDICFAYITRSVVIDHQLKKLYVQSIRGEFDEAWVNDTVERVCEAAACKSLESTPSATPIPKPDPLEKRGVMYQYIESCEQITAESTKYCDKVRACQDEIADGQSYELCLTTRNEIHARKPSACRSSQAEDNEHSWNLYKQMTGQNPAPFSAYMRMHNVHVLSSSPERYISWDRSQTAQCRPIKGTVQKKPGVTAEDAFEVLSSSKERAENLMIVDLTRHQLHGVYGSNNVRVSQLMEVEEYETLWQLVSVVDAVPSGIDKPTTPDSWEEPPEHASVTGKRTVPYIGFQAFVESLPPGSMTGAPKKRSCEILQEQEDHQRRGLYSGVLGYLDVGGAGDFSVVIRTAVKVDTPDVEEEDIWHIGAGGAVISQSTPEGEYEEMLAKFGSIARAFKHPPAPKNNSSSKNEIDLVKIWAAMRDAQHTLDDASDGDLQEEGNQVLLEIERELRQVYPEFTLNMGGALEDVEGSIGDDEDIPFPA